MDRSNLSDVDHASGRVNHEVKGKRRATESDERRVQRIDPERLRKAIQYLGEHPAISVTPPTTFADALFPEPRHK